LLTRKSREIVEIVGLAEKRKRIALFNIDSVI
jgi:hypothetical protein